jgi:hypothetical protein
MTTFFTVLVASFIGQGLLLWIVGSAAQKAEEKKAKAIQAALDEVMVERDAQIRRERERIARYAKMES